VDFARAVQRDQVEARPGHPECEVHVPRRALRPCAGRRSRWPPDEGDEHRRPSRCCL